MATIVLVTRSYIPRWDGTHPIRSPVGYKGDSVVD